MSQSCHHEDAGAAPRRCDRAAEPRPDRFEEGSGSDHSQPGGD